MIHSDAKRDGSLRQHVFVGNLMPSETAGTDKLRCTLSENSLGPALARSSLRWYSSPMTILHPYDLVGCLPLSVSDLLYHDARICLCCS